MAISGGIFMTISMRRDWSITFSKKINNKIGSIWNVVLWLTASVVFQTIVQVIVEISTDSSILTKVLTNIAMGFAFSLIPLTKTN